jgi:hypothetical protein
MKSQNGNVVVGVFAFSEDALEVEREKKMRFGTTTILLDRRFQDTIFQDSIDSFVNFSVWLFFAHFFSWWKRGDCFFP